MKCIAVQCLAAVAHVIVPYVMMLDCQGGILPYNNSRAESKPSRIIPGRQMANKPMPSIFDVVLAAAVAIY